MKLLIAALLSVLLPLAATAQERDLLREGNRLYKEKKYDSAAETYRSATAVKADYAAAWYNLGNALAQKKAYRQAREQYQAAVNTAKDKQTKAAAYYGMGNTFAEEKNWKEAVQSYKQALRNSPGDADAKYNLSFAQEKLKQQQAQQQQQQDQNDSQRNPKKDKNKKDDQQEENKDPQTKQQKDNNAQSQQGKRNQPGKSKLSKEQADNMLNALQQEEQRLHRERNKEHGVPANTNAKDW